MKKKFYLKKKFLSKKKRTIIFRVLFLLIEFSYEMYIKVIGFYFCLSEIKYVVKYNLGIGDKT